MIALLTKEYDDALPIQEMSQKVIDSLNFALSPPDNLVPFSRASPQYELNLRLKL